VRGSLRTWCHFHGGTATAFARPRPVSSLQVDEIPDFRSYGECSETTQAVNCTCRTLKLKKEGLSKASQTRRGDDVIERRMGDRRGRSINLESLPTGSVVYVGRDSFRMETVDFSNDGTGVVRAAPVVTTAPYGIDTRDEGRIVIELDREVDRAVSSASWRAPALDSLFGSQDAAPRLDAPTGEAALLLPAPPRRAALELSRAALAGAVALMFMGGLATASLVVPTRAAAPVALASPPVVIATPIEITAQDEPVAEVAAAPAPAEEPVAVAEPTTIQVEQPVTIRLARKAAPAPAAPATQVAAAPTAGFALEAPQAKWVDPFAD
jgi:hypothetical protein